MTSLELSKKIYQALIFNDELQNIVGQNVYPLIAESNTPYPFVVFKRMSITPYYTKDFLTYEDVQYEIVCCSDKYEQVIDMAILVRDEFEGIRGSGITSSVVSYINEDFINDCYVQRIGFTFRLIPTEQ